MKRIWRHLTDETPIWNWVIYCALIGIVFDDIGDHDWGGLIALAVGALIGVIWSIASYLRERTAA